MADADVRLRARNLSPHDSRAWLRIATDYLRGGDRPRAIHAALKARVLPEARTLLARLNAHHGVWYQPEADNARSRRSPLEGPVEGVIAWSMRLPRGAASAPLVDLGGDLWIELKLGSVLRVRPSARTAETVGRWTALTSPALIDGAVGAFDPSVHASRGPDPERPDDRWPTLPTPEGLFVMRPDQGVFATDADGIVRWRRDVPSPCTFAHVPGAPLVVLSHAAEVDVSVPVLRGLDPDSGAVRWRVDLDSTRTHPEALTLSLAAGGEAIVRTDESLRLYDLRGELRWERRLSGCAPPGVSADQVVTGVFRQGVLGFDLETGEERTRVGFSSLRSPAIDAEGQTFVVSLDGEVLALDPEGRVRWRLRLPRTGGPPLAPVVGVDRTLFVVSGWQLFAVV